MARRLAGLEATIKPLPQCLSHKRLRDTVEHRIILDFSMLSILLALIASPVQAQPSFPRPLSNPNEWVRTSDYPEEALKKNQLGLVAFALEVDSDGRASACHIRQTTGFWALDNRTCSLLIERARFRPNQPGIYYGRFMWQNPRVTEEGWEAIVDQVGLPVRAKIMVKSLPADYREPALVRVHFDTPRECRVEQTSGNAAIDRIACQQAIAQADRADAKPQLRERLDTRTYSIEFVADTRQ
jgi:hypothetical protein